MTLLFYNKSTVWHAYLYKVSYQHYFKEDFKFNNNYAIQHKYVKTLAEKNHD